MAFQNTLRSLQSLSSLVVYDTLSQKPTAYSKSRRLSLGAGRGRPRRAARASTCVRRQYTSIWGKSSELNFDTQSGCKTSLEAFEDDRRSSNATRRARWFFCAGSLRWLFCHTYSRSSPNRRDWKLETEVRVSRTILPLDGGLDRKRPPPSFSLQPNDTASTRVVSFCTRIEGFHSPRFGHDRSVFWKSH